MKKTLQILAVLLILGVSAVLGSTAIQALASDSAPANPPACPAGTEGCNTPINVSSSVQFKTGGIGIGYPSGQTVFRANAKTAVGENLLFDVWGEAMAIDLFTGTLHVLGGTDQATAGKVLMAEDDNGTAYWADLPPGCIPVP